jgi:chromatin remodeling complex protein RSC6
MLTIIKEEKMAKKTVVKKVVAKAKAAEKKVVKKVVAKAKAAEKKVVKKVAAVKKKVAKKVKRAPNPAFMKPMQISDALAKIVGSKPLPRTEVTKKLWEYIKKNKLQDSVNKRDINADENLKAIFGGKSKVSMFEMTKLVNKHLS